MNHNSNSQYFQYNNNNSPNFKYNYSNSPNNKYNNNNSPNYKYSNYLNKKINRPYHYLLIFPYLYRPISNYKNALMILNFAFKNTTVLNY